jgi:hypothetical protein
VREQFFKELPTEEDYEHALFVLMELQVGETGAGRDKKVMLQSHARKYADSQ